MDITEFLGAFFAAVGMVWTFLLVMGILGRLGSKQQVETYAKINGEVYPMKDILVAQAEYIDQSGYKGWLLWDLPTNKFLGQSTDPAKCVSMLQERFPGKTIFIKGLPE